MKISATPPPLAGLWAFCGLLVTAALGYLMVRYALFPSYYTHGEPTVAEVGWTLLHGRPLYPPIEAEDYLLIVYGPLLYQLNGIVTWLFGGTILGSKLLGIASAVGSVVAFWAFVHRTYGKGWIGPGLVLFSAILVMLVPVSFWVRSDPELVLFATLALLLCQIGEDKGSFWLGPIAIAVLAGLAVSMKVHGFLYFVPFVFRYALDRFWIRWPVMAVVSVAAVLLPFAWPGISVSEYQQSIGPVIGVRGIVPEILRNSARYILIFLSPAFLLLLYPICRKPLPKKADLWFAGSLVVTGLIMLYPASVLGTTWHHFVPLAPATAGVFLALAAGFGDLPRVTLGVIGVFSLAFVILTVTPQKRFLRLMEDRAWMRLAAAEVSDYIARVPTGALQMGFGDDIVESYRNTFVSPLVTFAGNPLTVEAWADMEAVFVGKPVPPGKLAYLAACKTPYWLIPTGETPFAMKSYFDGYRTYWPEFEQTFGQTYERVETGRTFDLWGCKDESLRPALRSAD